MIKEELKETDNNLFLDAIKIFSSNIRAIEVILTMQQIETIQQIEDEDKRNENNIYKKVARLSVYDSEREKIEKFLKNNNTFFSYSDFRIIQENDIGKGGFSNKGYILDNNSIKKLNSEIIKKTYSFIYISKNEKYSKLAKKYEKDGDNINLGKMLSYPECCVDFFQKNNGNQKIKQNDYVKPTFEVSYNTSQSIFFPFETNICSRYFDFQIISHFPCNFNCEKSICQGKRYLNLIKFLSKKLYHEIVYMLKVVVIYTEYDGVFILNDYSIEKNKKNKDKDKIKKSNREEKENKEHKESENFENSKKVEDKNKGKEFKILNVFYKEFHSTHDNDIAKILKRSNHISIINQKCFRVGNIEISNVNIMIFH